MSLLTQWAEENVSPPEPELGYRFLDITPLYEWAAANSVLFTKDNYGDAMRLYEMREKALSDWTSGVNHARREGIKEGRREVKNEVALNCKAMGMSIEQIAQWTGLTEQQIKDL